MKRRHESETDLAAAMQTVERLENATARREAGLAEYDARKEAQWAESNAKLEAKHAEEIRQAGDDILKAVQAVRELDSAWLADPSWSYRDEEVFRRYEEDRRPEDDIIKAVQAVREIHSDRLADYSWSHREEEAYGRFEAISKQRGENLSWQGVDSVVDPEPWREIPALDQSYSRSDLRGQDTPTQPRHSSWSYRGVGEALGPKPARHSTEVASEVMPVATEENRSKVGRGKKSQLQQWDDEEVVPKLAKRPAEPVPNVTPVATEEKRSKVGQGKESQLQQWGDEKMGPKLAKCPTEPVPNVTPVATEENRSKVGQGNESQPRQRGDKEIEPKLAKCPTEPASEMTLVVMEKGTELTHVRQSAEEDDVLLYPWRPNKGPGAGLTVHSCERMVEPLGQDVLLYPWWPDGARDFHWNGSSKCTGCEVQAVVEPMYGLPSICACLEASA